MTRRQYINIFCISAILQQALVDTKTDSNGDKKKESSSKIELKRKITRIKAENKAVIESLEYQNEAKMERLREEYSHETQSLVQMLNEEKQKANTKLELLKDKSQQVDLQTETKCTQDCNEDVGESNENEHLSVCLLNEFDIDEWRRKEVGWEESKKTLENSIHQLKQEIKEQNEFLEIKNKGKYQFP